MLSFCSNNFFLFSANIKCYYFLLASNYLNFYAISTFIYLRYLNSGAPLYTAPASRFKNSKKDFFMSLKLIICLDRKRSLLNIFVILYDDWQQNYKAAYRFWI